jgi:hypothetical protein
MARISGSSSERSGLSGNVALARVVLPDCHGAKSYPRTNKLPIQFLKYGKDLLSSMFNKNIPLVLFKVETDGCVAGSVVGEYPDQTFAGSRRNFSKLSGVTTVVLHCG